MQISIHLFIRRLWQSLLVLLYLGFVAFFILFQTTYLEQPVKYSTDMFKELSYEVGVGALVFFIIRVVMKRIFPEKYNNIKNCRDQQVASTESRYRDWQSWFTKNKFISLFIVVPAFICFCLIPLDINQYYAVEPEMIVSGLVIKKELRKSSRRRSSGFHEILLVKNDLEETWDIANAGCAFNQLEPGDRVTIIFRKGYLGIRYYLHIFTQNTEIYPADQRACLKALQNRGHSGVGEQTLALLFADEEGSIVQNLFLNGHNTKYQYQ